MSVYPLGGIPQSTFIGVTDVADLYPTHLDYLGYGGMRVIDTVANRNLLTDSTGIPTLRRAFGMLVLVNADPTPANNTLWILANVALGGTNNTITDNANWILFTASGAIVQPLNQVVYGTGAGISSNANFTWDNTNRKLTAGDTAGAFVFVNNTAGGERATLQTSLAGFVAGNGAGFLAPPPLAWALDGNTNIAILYTPNTSLYVDGTNFIYRMGDIDGAGNGTILSIYDTNAYLSVAAFGATHFSIDALTPSYFFGDGANATVYLSMSGGSQPFINHQAALSNGNASMGSGYSIDAASNPRIISTISASDTNISAQSARLGINATAGIVYIGDDDISSTPRSVPLRATGGYGGDIAGANLTLAGGPATGNAFGGAVNFQTSLVGSTGTTAQTLSTKAQVSGYLLSVIAGKSSSAFATVGGCKFDWKADVGNVTTGETDLYTYTTPASSLGTDGDKWESLYQIVCNGAVAATQDMRIYFGGTKIYDSGALSIGAITSNFTFNVLVLRESSTVVRCSVSVSTDFATLFPYSLYTRITGLTLSNTNILKITGQAGGASAATDQIVAKLGTVSWFPAALT